MKIGKTIKVKPIDIRNIDFTELKTNAFSLEGKHQINNENINHTYDFRHFRDRHLFHQGKRIPKFCTYISYQAWEDFMATAMSAYNDKKHEACGVIIGKYFIDQYGKFAVGTHFIKGTGISTSASLCEISYEDNAYIAQICQQTNSLQVVWIHSHPGYGIFYSGQDKETLRNKYYEDFHLGVVVDNRQLKYGAYKMFDNKMERWDKVFLFHEAYPKCFSPFKVSRNILNIIEDANEKMKSNIEDGLDDLKVNDENNNNIIIEDVEIIYDDIGNDTKIKNDIENIATDAEIDEEVNIDKEELITTNVEDETQQDKINNSNEITVIKEKQGSIQQDNSGKLENTNQGTIVQDNSSYHISTDKKKDEQFNRIQFMLILMLVFQVFTIGLAGGLITIIIKVLGN